MGQYVRVKKSLLHQLLILLGVPAFMTACKPQAIDMAELTRLQARNAQLRQEIADMEATIRRAGADIPDLADQLEARNKEVVQAYENLKKLKAQETEMHKRRIQLESRLDAFRASFQEMQNQIAASPKPQSQP